MRARLSYAFFVAALGVAGAPNAWGGAMRCGNKLVVVGDSMAAVRAYCGRPAQAQRSVAVSATTTRVGGRGVSRSRTAGAAVPVETWTYNRGPRKLLMSVRFVDGRVVAVKTLHTYGY